MNENLKAITNLSSVDSSIILHRYEETTPPYHTSIDISATGLYNLYQGVVCFIGNESGNTQFVCVKLSGAYILKYGHLESVSTGLNCRIRPGEVVGVCKKFGTFEFLTPSKSKFPIYVNSDKYYKHDPTDILINDILPTIRVSSYASTSDNSVALVGLET